ncbi:MAG TPA: twin-arginine translocase TatA/TatE family subunit [Methylomirabilota bacterium]|nr:twin-arginine translocase TatA/TatE family subunit [Methylomirabilota bacterium]
MFDIGLQELILIFVIALLVFGPKNLPQLGRSLGRAMREFRRASDEFRSTIETNLQINEPDPPPAPVIDTSPAPNAAASEALPETGSAGELGSVTPEGAVATEPASGEPYLAQRGSPIFHSRTCGWVRRIPEADRAYYKTVAEAKEGGLLPCPSCEPWEPV